MMQDLLQSASTLRKVWSMVIFIYFLIHKPWLNPVSDILFFGYRAPGFLKPLQLCMSLSSYVLKPQSNTQPCIGLEG